jgi:putative oxidoreductase
MEGLKAVAALIGRVLLVLIFLNSGIGKITNFEGTAQFMAKAGMPMTSFFLMGAIVFELWGSLSILIGYYTRFGTLLLILFLIPTTLIFHGHIGDRMQAINFMKNASMLGGLLLLLANGPGVISLDQLWRRKKRW